MKQDYKMKLSPCPILLIEDESGFSSPLKSQLERLLKPMSMPMVTVASTLDEADQQIKKMPYSALQIDLRLPKSRGGIVDGTPAGLHSAELATKLLPLAIGVLWSNFASIHPKAAQHAGKFDCAYWSKGDVPKDIITELPHYSAKTGAEAFARMLRLWPSEKPEPSEISWAGRYFKHARALLPEQLSACCGNLSSSVYALTESQAQATLPMLFEFSEWVQRWLWCVMAGVLKDANLLEKSPPWPFGLRGKSLTRQSMQERVGAMLVTWIASSVGKQKPLCLRYLNCVDQAENTLDIIEALDWIKTRRNDWAHIGSIAGAPAMLEELATPFRLIMQAASFLAAWPMVTDVEAVGYRWRVTCVRGAYPWPKEEWDLKLPNNFSPKPGHVYQMWPHEDGSVGLLNLWPWLECRPDDDFHRQRLWMALGPSDGRAIIESSFNELNKEVRFAKNAPTPKPYRPMSVARQEALDDISTRLKL